VGAGTITQQAHLPVLLSSPGVTIAWITDASWERARSVGHAFQLPAVPLPASAADLPPCDVALLATPPGFRLPYYEAFAAKGTAVFGEKPLTITVADHLRVVDLFPPHGLACGFMRRTYASSQLLRSAVSGRWFGPLQRIRIAEGARTTATGTSQSHLDDPGAAGGGVLISLGCHSLDQALYTALASSYDIVDCAMIFDGAIERKVTARLVLHQQEGSVDVEYCMSWLDPQENTIEFHFPSAVIVIGINPQTPIVLREASHGRDLAQLSLTAPGARTSYQAFFLEWNWFLRGLSERQPSAVSASSAVTTARLVEDLYARGKRE